MLEGRLPILVIALSLSLPTVLISIAPDAGARQLLEDPRQTNSTVGRPSLINEFVPVSVDMPPQAGPLTMSLAVVPSRADEVQLVARLASTDEIPAGTASVSIPEGVDVLDGSTTWSFAIGKGDAAEHEIRISIPADGSYYFLGDARGSLDAASTAVAGDELKIEVTNGLALGREVVHEPPPLVMEVSFSEAAALVVPEPGTLTSPTPAGTIRINGHVNYQPSWTPGAYRNLPRAGIRIYDAGASDVYRGGGTANANGDFSITIDGSNGIRLKIGVTTQSYWVTEGPTGCSCIYESKTGVYGFYPDGSTINVGSIGVTHAVWNVYGALTEAHEKILQSPGTDVGPVQVNYPDGTYYYTTVTNFGGDTIHVPDYQAGKEATQFYNSLQHEYTHHAMNMVNGQQPNLYSSCPGNDYRYSQNAGCALAEGYATFMPIYMNNSYSVYSSPALTTDMEARPGVDWGSNTPYRVAGALVDMFDSSNAGSNDDSIDFFSTTMDRLWLPVMKQPYQNPAYDFTSYYYNWLARGDHDGHFINAADMNRIEQFDTTGPRSFVDRPAPNCNYAQDIQTVCIPNSGVSTVTGTQITVTGHGDDNLDGHGVMRVIIIVDDAIRYQSPPDSSSGSWTWNFQTSDYGRSHRVTIRTLDYAGTSTDATNSNVAIASE